MQQKKNNPNEQTDEVLVTRTLAGEREAFEELLIRYSASVHQLCVRLLSATLEAQDVAQEAALQAFLGLERLQEPARFGAWFHAIAANLARSALRQKRDLSSLHILTDESMIHLLWNTIPLSLEEIHDARETHDEILAALNELSLVNRQAVIGFYLQGYSYAELAQLLGVSVSTVKGRLFQGRQQLKTVLQPFAPTKIRQITHQQRKDASSMTTAPELVKLEIDTLRTLLLTQQRFVILRDPISERGLPIRLTQNEAETLFQALSMQDFKDIPAIPLDLTSRILATLGGQVSRIIINTLAEQTYYATLELSLASQTYETDVRISDALTLAAQTGAALYATRTLLEATAQLNPNSEGTILEQKDLLEQAKNIQQMSREERLQLEESLHRAQTAHQRKRTDKQPERGRTDKFPERLWPLLLEGLTGSRDDISLAELRALDPTTAFTPRELTWDEQPMTALHIPDAQESIWLLIRTPMWNSLKGMFKSLQEPEQTQEQETLSAHQVPNPLPSESKLKAEACLAQLVSEGDLRAALLLNPQNELIVWQGAESDEVLHHFVSSLNEDLTKQAPLKNQPDLNRLLGHQPQKAAIMQGGGHKKEIMGSLPDELGGGVAVLQIYQDWKLVIIFAKIPAEDPNDKTHKHTRQIKQTLTDVLAQA